MSGSTEWFVSDFGFIVSVPVEEVPERYGGQGRGSKYSFSCMVCVGGDHWLDTLSEAFICNRCGYQVAFEDSVHLVARSNSLPTTWFTVGEKFS